jgi:rhomboid protease GluP
MYLLTVIYSMRSGNSSAFMNIDVRTLLHFGAISPVALQLGQWWRLVTAGYLHGGLLHIGMNMWVLTMVSAQVEELYGPARMFVFFAIASVCGFYLSSVLVGTISVGASAGLTGLIGVMIAFGIHHRSAIGDAIKKQYLIWVGYILVSGFIIPGVDNAAHVGGLIGGFALAYLAGAPAYRNSASESFWKLAALICVLVTVFCFYKMYLFFVASAQ